MIADDLAREHPHIAHILRLDQPQETPVTGPDDQPVPVFAKTAWQSAHEAAKYAEQVLGGALKAVGHIAQLGEHAITDPMVDDCLETVLRAYNLGVEASAFQAAIAVLRDAMTRKTVPAPPESSGTAPVAAVSVVNDSQDGSTNENGAPVPSDATSTDTPTVTDVPASSLGALDAIAANGNQPQ